MTPMELITICITLLVRSLPRLRNCEPISRFLFLPPAKSADLAAASGENQFGCSFAPIVFGLRVASRELRAAAASRPNGLARALPAERSAKPRPPHLPFGRKVKAALPTARPAHFKGRPSGRQEVEEEDAKVGRGGAGADGGRRAPQGEREREREIREAALGASAV